MENYYQHIKQQHDSETHFHVKHYINLNKKLATQTARLKFLVECKGYGLMPKHISNTTNNITIHLQSNTAKKNLKNIHSTFHNKIINLQIKDANIYIKQLKTEMNTIIRYLNIDLGPKDTEKFKTNQKTHFNNKFNKAAQNHNNKLNTMKEEKFKQLGIIINQEWVVNKTNIVFPKECEWIISLGRKFALPSTNEFIKPIHLIADFEQIIYNIKDENEKDTIRTKFANKLLTLKRLNKTNTTDKFIIKTYKTTQDFIKKHRKEILIVEADKGNKTVIMKKEEYNNKMERLLEDKNTYRKSRTDPTEQLTRKNNKIINELYNQKTIDTRQKHLMYCSAANPPRLYGLPKIHKTDMPLRPIASSCEVPCYQMAKFLGSILKNLVSNKYNTTNSLELKDKLSAIKPGPDEIMVSFDVVSLFTNIPLNTAIKIIMNKWTEIQKHTTINRTQFLNMLNFCLKDNNYFKEKEQIYIQTYGMPMGNPLSPTIANIVLDNLLDERLNILQTKNIKIPFIIKYVDDLFAIIKATDQNKILDELNNYHTRIKFTLEIEEGGQINFLDTKIHKTNSQFIIDWHTKPYSSGRLINFHSNHPRYQIMNTAKNLIDKVLKISDQKFHKTNLTKIKNILKQNCFPNNIIKTLTNTTIRPTNRNQTQEGGKNKYYSSIAYIKNLTDKQTLHTSIGQTTDIALKPNRTTNDLFSNTKSKIEKERRCNVIYQIQCNGNENEICTNTYVGTTRRHLGTRLKEHAKTIEQKKPSTALAQHMIDKNHTADLTTTKILDREGKQNKRLTLESLYIKMHQKKTVNKKEDFDNISAAYNALLEQQT